MKRHDSRRTDQGAVDQSAKATGENRQAECQQHGRCESGLAGADRRILQLQCQDGTAQRQRRSGGKINPGRDDDDRHPKCGNGNQRRRTHDHSHIADRQKITFAQQLIRDREQQHDEQQGKHRPELRAK